MPERPLSEAARGRRAGPAPNGRPVRPARVRQTVLKDLTVLRSPCRVSRACLVLLQIYRLALACTSLSRLHCRPGVPAIRLRKALTPGGVQTPQALRLDRPPETALMEPPPGVCAELLARSSAAVGALPVRVGIAPVVQASNARPTAKRSFNGRDPGALGGACGMRMPGRAAG